MARRQSKGRKEKSQGLISWVLHILIRCIYFLKHCIFINTRFCYIGLAGPKLTEICLPLSAKCGMKGMHPIPGLKTTILTQLQINYSKEKPFSLTCTHSSRIKQSLCFMLAGEPGFLYENEEIETRSWIPLSCTVLQQSRIVTLQLT